MEGKEKFLQQNANQYGRKDEEIRKLPSGKQLPE